MGYFPFFINIEGKKCLVAGGGNVALRKIEKLIPYGPEITVISMRVSEEIKKLSELKKTESGNHLPLKIIIRKACPSDAEGFDFVINATGDPELSKSMKDFCVEKRIPCNSVDDRENCTFFFPALVHRDGISVGISTEGKSPLYARALKEKINNLMDAEDPHIVEEMAKWRSYIRDKADTEEKRKRILEEILEKISEGGHPGRGDVDKMI